MFQRSQMAHSCTEMWLVSVQPEGVRAGPAPKAWSSCPLQDPREGSTGNTGDDRWSLTLLWTRRLLKKTQPGACF